MQVFTSGCDALTSLQTSALFLSKSKSAAKFLGFGQLLAVQAWGKWVFRPAQLNNQPIVMKVLIGIAGSSAVVKGEGTGELRSNPVPIFDSSIGSVDCVNDM